jgi:hypothetical protein
MCKGIAYEYRVQTPCKAENPDTAKSGPLTTRPVTPLYGLPMGLVSDFDIT